jgi:type III secretion protein T
MMHAEPFATLLQLARLPLAAFGLGFARIFGLLALLPISTRLGLRGLQRAGVAAAIAAMLMPALMPALAATPVDGTRFALLAVKETGIGFILGVLFAGPFWAAETAGELLDQQRGSRAAVAPDAANQEQGGITATLLVLTLVTIFFASDGMHLLLDGVFASYRVWPVLELAPQFAPDAALQLLAMLDSILRAGFVLAAPLVLAMLLTEFSLALLSRFAPQLNVFDLAMSVKGLIYVIGLPIYATFLTGYLRDGLAPLVRVGDTMLQLSGR